MAEDKIQSAEEQLRFGDDTSTTADDGQAISTSVVEKLVVQSVTLSDAAKDIVPSPDEKLGIGNNTSTDTKDVQVTSISGEEKLEVCKQTSPATEDSKVNWMLFEQKLNAHDDTSSDPQEVQVPSTSEATQQFGDETLRAMAKVYLEDGNKEYRKKEVHSAIHFYTNGLLVNCNDDRLNAKLCSNRAAVHFYLGNYKETLVDATVSVHLEPSLIKAIVKGDGKATSPSVVEKLDVQSVILSDMAKDNVPSPDEKLGTGDNTSTAMEDPHVTSISRKETKHP